LSADPWRSLARIRNETLSVEPAVTFVGESQAGTDRLIPVTLHNYSNKPIKVIGGTVSCVCMTLQDLPVTVPAHGTATVHVNVIFRGTLGQFTHSFKFYHSGREQSTAGRFTGSVTAPKETTTLQEQHALHSPR